jgi:hypothetical protein
MNNKQRKSPAMNVYALMREERRVGKTGSSMYVCTRMYVCMYVLYLSLLYALTVGFNGHGGDSQLGVDCPDEYTNAAATKTSSADACGSCCSFCCGLFSSVGDALVVKGEYCDLSPSKVLFSKM